MLDPDEEYHDLASLVRAKAKKNERKLAAVFPGARRTYRELDHASDRVAAGFRKVGIGPGDHLAVLLFNGPEFLETWFATAKLGAVMVPLNTGLKGELLRYELDDCRPKGLVVDARLWDAYRPYREGLAIAHEWGVGPELPPMVTGYPDLLDHGELPMTPAPAPHQPASILYTSGTTGPPKGAVIPHEKLISTPREIALRSELDPNSVLFTGLPLFHCNAQEMTTLTAMLHDLTAAFDERFHASNYWETAAEFEATHISLLISMINVLFKQPEKPSDRTHTVRVALSAGATRELWPLFEQRFGLRLVELYGMTECGCTTLMNPVGRVRVGSIGTELGFVEADVVDDDDRPVPAGTRGELVVRPRRPFTMFLGYHNKAEKTVESWRNLWFHTGDYVTRDSDGYYYFVDRKKDVIRRRGENLAPYDVESVLNRHPSVFESVVVGVPSPLGEEDVKAFVVLRPGRTVAPRELFEFCIEHLPFFMVPRFIEFLDEVPKTANQKAQRFVLKGRRGEAEHDRETLGLVVRKP